MEGEITKIINEVGEKVSTKYTSKIVTEEDKESVKNLIYNLIKYSFTIFPYTYAENKKTIIDISLIGDILIFIYNWVYPISFLGAMFYTGKQLIDADPSTIITNKNLTVVFNIIIMISGGISMYLWFSRNTIIDLLESGTSEIVNQLVTGIPSLTIKMQINEVIKQLPNTIKSRLQ